MWEENCVETDRGRFEYFVCGEGEPLAITHFYMAFDVRGSLFASPFTEQYKVYLINVRGAGKSAEIESDSQLRLKEMVKDLEAIREAFGLEKWAFAGHSTGGMLALQYAIEAPNSLIKVIAGCTAASNEYARHPKSIYCTENKNFQRIIKIMELLNSSNTIQEDREKLSYEWALMSYHSEEKLKQALTRPNSGRTIGRSLDYFRKIEMKDFDLRDQLNKIHIPTYVFAGKYDAQCPVEYCIEIATLIPDAKLTVFEKSNHNPFIEEEEAFKDFVKLTLSSGS
ncbi:alpha/beta fold hydrolase [Paenibacillus gallinarum]|uniref:Alpha/beta hydrolase n=1 Tax=Paenibacillus gallinarum TaxID=2762232 RepID=A0ABR8SUX9_9BACL|nr:alpha/beta hydrolase [Paenibacillus gallinarum]MBD7967308.1 alpha/beta hydrolase [Paenibacillus gallinarum]